MNTYGLSKEQIAKKHREHANRSYAQQKRLDREFAEGYHAYLRGQVAAAPISGAAPIDTGQYITVAQAAKRLGISRQRAYILVYQDRLDAHLVAGRWLINGDNLTIKPPQWKEKKP